MKHSILLSILALSVQFGMAQSTLINITTDSDSKDAVVETYAPYLNGGSDAVVFVSAWTNGGTNNTKRYFIEFDLNVVPSSAIIDSAKLSLYKGNTSLMSNMHQGTNNWEIRRVLQSWTEQTITWNNQPTSTATNKTSVPATTSPYQDFPDLDVTLLVEDAIAYGNYGFVAQLASEVTYKAVLLASTDYATTSARPNLKIWYHMPCTTTASYTYAIQNNTTTVNFTNTTATGSNAIYSWDFGNGYFSTQENTTYTYPVGGNYSVCFSVTDSCGTDTHCQNIYVSGIGINENEKASVTIYPNPTSGILHVEGNSEEITSVELFSISGQQLKVLPVIDNEINISQFAKGMYFLHLNGETETQIIKVQKL